MPFTPHHLGLADVRIPQATIQIAAGTIEGSGPLDVLVSITDPETGQFTRAQVTVAVAEASPVGPGPELFASSGYIAREGLFKFPGLKVGTYIVSATVKGTVGSVLFSKSRLPLGSPPQESPRQLWLQPQPLRRAPRHQQPLLATAPKRLVGPPTIRCPVLL